MPPAVISGELALIDLAFEPPDADGWRTAD
jgi:hypothetical protein